MRISIGIVLPLLCTLIVNRTIEAAGSAASTSPEIQKILNHYRRGEYSQVTKLGWSHIEKIDKYTLFLLGESHDKLKQFGEVRRVADLMLAKNENDFQALVLKGRSYLGQKNDNEALEWFKKAAEANRKYRPAYLGLADIYRRRENHYELRILYEDMIKEFGPEAEFYAQLCEINTNDGTNTQALQACNKGIQLDSTNANNFVYRGVVLKQQGETESAFRQLKEVAQKFPKSIVAQYTYATLLEEKKDYIESTKYYKATVELDSKNDRAWVGLARSAFQIKNFELTYNAISKACALKRQNTIELRGLIKSIDRLPASSAEGAREWIGKLRALETRYDQH